MSQCVSVTASEASDTTTDTSSLPSTKGDSDVEPDLSGDGEEGERKHDVRAYTVKLEHGLTFGTVDNDVVVNKVAEGSSGEAQHVPVGHVIKAINNYQITSEEVLQHALKSIKTRGHKEFTLHLSDYVATDIQKQVTLHLLHSRQSLGFEYEMKGELLIVTDVEEHGALAYARVPRGAIIRSIEGKEIKSEKDLAQCLASIHDSGNTTIPLKVTIVKGSAYGESASFFASPARSKTEEMSRENLRREIHMYTAKVKQLERRIDSVNGFALTYADFLHNYGDAAGRARWEAASTKTALIGKSDIKATSALEVDDIGKRLQMTESGVVLVCIVMGSGLGWHKAEDLTKGEQSYRDLCHSTPGRPTVVVPKTHMAPTSDLTEQDLGQRVQTDTGEVFTVASVGRGRGVGWYQVPEIDWSTAENAYAANKEMKNGATRCVDSNLKSLFTGALPMCTIDLSGGGK